MKGLQTTSNTAKVDGVSKKVQITVKRNSGDVP